jgi:hypothetical protein
VVHSHYFTMHASFHILHPTDHQDNNRYYMEDGWIYLASPCQRLCWIPVKCRGKLTSSRKKIALGTPDGQIVVLDFSSTIV